MLTQVANTIFGLWLMAAPAILGYGDPAQVNDRIFGPIIACFAAVAITGATRPLGRINAPLGLWLVLAPWVLGYGTTATVNSTIVGLLVVACAVPVVGYDAKEFGGGWSSVWRSSQAD